MSGNRQAFFGLPTAVKVLGLHFISEQRAIMNRRTVGANPPPACDHSDSLQWEMTSRQVPLKDFSADIQRIMSNLFARTSADSWGDRFEYASLALEMGDGGVISPLAIEATSYDENQVKFNMGFLDEVAVRAGERARNKPGLVNGKIRLILMHTHPQDPENLEVVRVNEDGLYYTGLSQKDYYGLDIHLDRLIGCLRRKGFTGPIEVVEAAVPVPLMPLAGSDPNYYVSTYTRHIPALS
ncbi:MAG: hypothetical protein WC645_03870 [Candidatus Margulisiibacteriota bacterium]